MAEPTSLRSWAMSDANGEASMALGMAAGLATMCAGHIDETGDEDRCSASHLNDVVRYIATLAREAEVAAKRAPIQVREVVRMARSISEMVAAEATVEILGRHGQHWNDDITSWGLTALGNALKRARAAVDGDGVESESHVEVAHA